MICRLQVRFFSTVTPKNLLSMGKLAIFNVLGSSTFLARKNIILRFLKVKAEAIRVNPFEKNFTKIT